MLLENVLPARRARVSFWDAEAIVAADERGRFCIPPGGRGALSLRGAVALRSRVVSSRTRARRARVLVGDADASLLSVSSL